VIKSAAKAKTRKSARAAAHGRSTGAQTRRKREKGGRLPRHIAIIMDGNGRWAQQRGQARTGGHRAGADSVREITAECSRMGLEQLTLYAFSSENWRRPKTEVRFLMRLLRRYLIDERDETDENNVRLKAIGRIQELPASVQRELAASIERSSRNTGMILRLALNYGGRAEIADAARRLAEKVLAGEIAAADVDEAALQGCMYDDEMTDPDLLIRTGGEMRVSNFLLWHISYSEFYVTPTYWPEFRKEHLAQAIDDYARRERRFGGVTRPATSMGRLMGAVQARLRR